MYISKEIYIYTNFYIIWYYKHLFNKIWWKTDYNVRGMLLMCAPSSGKVSKETYWIFLEINNNFLVASNFSKYGT